jgi:hypothetical protein
MHGATVKIKKKPVIKLTVYFIIDSVKEALDTPT